MTCTSTRYTAVSTQAQRMAGMVVWFDLRLYEHTFVLEESPSAEIGRRRTSKARGCHAASRHADTPENCCCTSDLRRRLRCK